LRAKRDSRDDFRNAEEALESIRRDQVERGAWAEHESRIKLNELLDEVFEEFPTQKSIDIHDREFAKAHENYLKARSSKIL
jgi:hypothetical protein